MGGGVIGVTTAYYLARAGHEVTVIERHAGAGEETSFANAGIVATGHCQSWASPRAPLMLLASLFQKDATLRLRLHADPRMWAWCLRFLKNCTAARFRENTLTKLRLCQYSQDALDEVRRETEIGFDSRSQGALYLYRDRGTFEDAVEIMAMLNDNGLELEAADPDRCAEIEPALEPVKHKFVGATYSPTDECGDSYAFTRELVRISKDMGVSFRFNTTISGLRAEGDRIAGVLTDRGDVAGDVYVLALASYSPIVARGLGIRLPVYPVKGYSATIPTAGFGGAPTVPGIDIDRHVAFVQLGERLRITATAEFTGYDTRFEAADFAPMLGVVRDLFPEAGDFAKPEYWACLRPMTPDGPPILGRGRHANLFFNTGHGSMGWTMCCGSGRITADLISGASPDIDLAGMGLERFS